MEKKNDRNKNTSQNKLYSDEIKEMERLSEEQEKALRERRQARKHRIKKNVPPGNYLSRYGTFLLFGSFTRISPRRSAVLLLPAPQDARSFCSGPQPSAPPAHTCSRHGENEPDISYSDPPGNIFPMTDEAEVPNNTNLPNNFGGISTDPPQPPTC